MPQLEGDVIKLVSGDSNRLNGMTKQSVDAQISHAKEVLLDTDKSSQIGEEINVLPVRKREELLTSQVSNVSIEMKKISSQIERLDKRMGALQNVCN